MTDLQCSVEKCERELRDRTFAEVFLREALARAEAALRQERESAEQCEILNELAAGQREAKNRALSVTPRQRKIIDLVLAGYRSKDIVRVLAPAYALPRTIARRSFRLQVQRLFRREHRRNEDFQDQALSNTE